MQKLHTILNMAPRKNRIVVGLTSLSSIISSTTLRTSRELTLRMEIANKQQRKWNGIFQQNQFSNPTLQKQTRRHETPNHRLTCSTAKSYKSSYAPKNQSRESPTTSSSHPQAPDANNSPIPTLPLPCSNRMIVGRLSRCWRGWMMRGMMLRCDLD